MPGGWDDGDDAWKSRLMSATSCAPSPFTSPIGMTSLNARSRVRSTKFGSAGNVRSPLPRKTEMSVRGLVFVADEET